MGLRDERGTTVDSAAPVRPRAPQQPVPSDPAAAEHIPGAPPAGVGRPPDSLDRSVSAVDSGYNGQDGDGHDDDDLDDGASSVCTRTRSDSGSCSSVSSSSTGVPQTVAECFAVDADKGSAFIQGDVYVENSTNVQVGTTHYHGPVTVVVAQKNEAAPLTPPAGVTVVKGAPLGAVVDALSPVGDAVQLPVTGSTTQLTEKGAVSAAAPDALWRSFLRCPRVAVPGAVLAIPIIALVVYLTTTRPSIEELPNGVRLATRSFWRARSPSEPPELLRTPVKLVVVCHTAGKPCFNPRLCADMVSNMQQYHKDSHTWDDIGYNFLVSGDGVVYEGRGWDAVGAFLPGKNRLALGVALIGNFEIDLITDSQEDQLRKFLDWGVELGKIERGYKIGGACQYQATMSPGRTFMQNLRTWSHWDTYMLNNDSCVR